MKTPFYFHVGYPKAASSTLQKHVFDRHPQLNFLGRYPLANVGQSVGDVNIESAFVKDKRLQKIHQELVQSSDTLETKARFLELLREYERHDNSMPIFSNESVTSVFFSHPDIRYKIEKIAELTCTKVIIVIRNQLDMIKSQYRDHPYEPSDLIHGKPVSIDDWVIKAKDLEFSFLDSLLYDRWIELLEKIFGPENVVVLIFEELHQFPDLFARKMAHALDLDEAVTIELVCNAPAENQGVSMRYNQLWAIKKKVFGNLPLSRYLPGKLVERTKSIAKKGKKANYHFNQETLEYLTGYYSPCNRHLANRFDLKNYPYPV